MDFMKFQSLFSRTIGQIVLGVSGLTYANQLWTSPFEKVINVGLSAFGVIGALSALSFTMVPCLSTEDERQLTLYGAEKFFHSSLLLIQTIFMKFAGESVANLQFIVNIPWMHTLFLAITSIAASFTGAVATWFAIYGFDSLNDLFWQRYDKRRGKSFSKKK